MAAILKCSIHPCLQVYMAPKNQWSWKLMCNDNDDQTTFNAYLSMFISTTPSAQYLYETQNIRWAVVVAPIDFYGSTIVSYTYGLFDYPRIE